MKSCVSNECSFFWKQMKAAALISTTNRYLWACLVYLIYSIGMILADDPTITASRRNDFYFFFGIVHLINAFMFIWTWKGKSYTDKVMIPEYFNVVGAILYLWSSTYYGKEYDSDDDDAAFSPSFYIERKLEFWASILEVFAAFGWVYSWHVGYLEMKRESPGPIPGRGWTFDDPDIAANITITAAAVTYFLYNWQVINDYSSYENNNLYQLGDQIYMANSVFYVMAALRDCGWFWFMPYFGQYRTITEIMEEDRQSEEHSYAKIVLESSAELEEDSEMLTALHSSSGK